MVAGLQTKGVAVSRIFAEAFEFVDGPVPRERRGTQLRLAALGTAAALILAVGGATMIRSGGASAGHSHDQAAEGPANEH